MHLHFLAEKVEAKKKGQFIQATQIDTCVYNNDQLQRTSANEKVLKITKFPKLPLTVVPAVVTFISVSYTHLTLPTTAEV